MTPQPLDILKQYWGFESFKGEQENIIRAILQQKDVLALLPTGGGKSICFQVSTLMMDGLCIVVTPLIALMKDQVENLLAKNISACAVHSGLNAEEVEACLQSAAEEKYKFLYISPERIETDLFQSFLGELNIALIAVDEAHCISQWGYDFRPPYLRIAQLRNYFPKVPVLALTASATTKVQADIVRNLKFKEYSTFKQSVQRINLAYQVWKCENKLTKLVQLLASTSGCGIVYCKTRREAQDVAGYLNLRGIDADYYHAGLTQEERNTRQERWMSNHTRIIVCTNAFGMGIDKPDVRLVAHYEPPDCLENYYQETGRAGRDGQPAQAVLLYQLNDIESLRELPEIRFPTFQIIQKTYQHLSDFLQIPIGIGKDIYYDFDLNTFIRNFHLPPVQTVYAIKALEQEGLMTFNESVFFPAKVSFTIDRERLYIFEETYTALDPIIQCLLRGYEGIFNHRVSVFENQIARWMHIPPETVTQQLKDLHRHQVIEYLPPKDTPQILFLANRAQAQFLSFEHKPYLDRKQVFTQRVNKMLEYIQSGKCRSSLISAYFGEENSPKCHLCDNCKQASISKITNKELAQICKSILQQLEKTATALPEVYAAFNNEPREHVQSALQLLKAEGLIRMNKDGKLVLN